MPIITSVPLVEPTRERYHEIDHLATGLAFEIHNEFGRLMDEKLYQAAMLRSMERSRLEVLREVKVTAVHDSFRKDYFLDFLIASCVVLETKAVEKLTPAHQSQLLHYLFLCTLHHGTLLNFRTPRVEHEFVSTQHTLESRRRYSVDERRWTPQGAEVSALKERVLALFDDWGCLLEVSLYREALAHFCGGQEVVFRPVEVRAEGQLIGSQRFHLLTPDIAFSFTAARRPAEIEAHLVRLMSHTVLRSIAWINMNQTSISFVTLAQNDALHSAN